MTIRSFIEALPKVDLNVQFEGSLPRDFLLLLRDQNDIPTSMKSVRQYNELMAQLDKADPKRIYEFVGRFARWIQYPEDLTRAVYEVGLALYKQNVRYAEVQISPSIYIANGIAFETFLNAINDGRDRVWRAWQVKMNWILSIPRDDPRSGDEVARWAVSATAKRGNVVGLGVNSIRINREVAKKSAVSPVRRGASTVSPTLSDDDIQPVGQFVRPFTTAQKKELATVATAHNHPKVESLPEILKALSPNRLHEVGEGLSDEVQFQALKEQKAICVVTPTREWRLGKVETLNAFPYRALMEAVPMCLSASMPTFYRTTLNEEYALAVEQGGLSTEEIEQIALNSVSSSFLSDEDKHSLLDSFKSAYASLRAEHLS